MKGVLVTWVEEQTVPYTEFTMMNTMNTFMLNPTDKSLLTNIREFGIIDADNRIVVKMRDGSDEQVRLFKEKVTSSDAIVFEKSTSDVTAKGAEEPIDDKEPIARAASVNPGSKITCRLDSTYATAGYRVKIRLVQ